MLQDTLQATPHLSLPHFLRTTWGKVLIALLAVILILRIIAPPIILKNLNKHLAEVSPLYSIQIHDLDLHIIRMAYAFEDVIGVLKKDNSRFMTIQKVNVGIAWRELFRGKFVADVVLHNADLKITTETIQALSGYSKDKAKQEAKDVKDSTVPFDLESLKTTDSRFEFSDVAGLPAEQNFYLSKIEAQANNLTPTEEQGISMFTASGAIQGNADIKLVGQLKPKRKPAEWSINLELKKLKLTDINPIARRTGSVSFKSGTLSLYSAARSEEGKLKGYVKPFLKDLVFVGDRGDFKNVPQFLIEIAGTIGNFFLKNRDTHALATKVEFKTVNGKVQSNTSKAISTAIDNGFGEPLRESLDETLELKEE